MKELVVDATVENLTKVTAFLDEELESFSCPMKEQTAIDIAVDEIYSNIANYAYKDTVGKATVRIDVTSDRMAVISFLDEGIPYDPLKREDPNINASIDERGIGGLGILIVKKSMDDVNYEYKDGKNILTIKKKI